MKKLFVCLVLVAVMLLPVQLRAQTAVKIGTIDLQRVMMESEKGKQAKKVLTDEAEKLKKTLSAKQDELQKLKDAVEKQGATITPEARADKEKQYQAKLKDYQRIAGDYQTELQQKDAEYSQRILKELEEIVKNLATTQGYTVILERGQAGVLFAAPSIDMSDQIIKLYNASGTKGAAPAKK